MYWRKFICWQLAVDFYSPLLLKILKSVYDTQYQYKSARSIY